MVPPGVICVRRCAVVTVSGATWCNVCKEMCCSYSKWCPGVMCVRRCAVVTVSGAPWCNVCKSRRTVVTVSGVPWCNVCKEDAL